MLSQEIQQSPAVDQLNGLVFGEVVCVRPIAAGADQNTFVRSFVEHRSIQIPYGTYSDCVAIAFGLNDHLTAEHRTGIECDCIDSSIPRTARKLGIESHLAEEIGNKLLEGGGSQVQ